MPKHVKWEVVQTDAGQWDGYDDYRIFYIYNSFPEKVVREVVEKLEDSWARNRRDMYVWYLNPEFPEIFEQRNGKWKMIRRGHFWELRQGMYIFKYEINE